MNGVIRWSGVIIFLVVTGMFTAINLLVLPTALKWGLETQIARKTGAEVNIENVAVSWSPTGVTIDGVQIADAANPDQNLVAATKITSDIHPVDFMLGRINIDEMNISGLRFNSPRSSRAAVYREPEPAGEQSNETGLPDFDIQLPDPKELVSQSNLLTVQRSKELKSVVAEEKQKILALKEQLPSKDKLKSYETRLKKLIDSKPKTVEDFARIKDAFSALKKEFKQDKDLVKQVKDQISESKTSISDAVTALKSAPQEDLSQIKSNLKLDDQTLARATEYAFGAKAGELTRQATAIYQQVKPFLSTESKEESLRVLVEGQRIDFTPKAQPDLWVKSINVDMTLPETSDVAKADIEISDLTTEHAIIGKDTVFSLQGLTKEQQPMITLNGHGQLQQNDVIAEATWAINNFPVPPTDLLKDQALSLTQANVSLTGSSSLNGETMQHNGDVSLNNLNVTTARNDKFSSTIVQAMNDATNIDMSFSVGGSVYEPDVALESGLDNVMSDLLDSALKAQINNFEASVNEQLQKTVTDSIAESTSDQQSIEAITGDVLNTEGSLDSLSNQELSPYKDKLKDKLKSKLGKLFGGDDD